MHLSNSFSIARPPVEVFDAFFDIAGTATCMPGSRYLGNPEPDTHDGEVTVKVGPLRVDYSGQCTILDVDRDQLRLTMRAKGREQRGAGDADAHIVAQMSQQHGATLVEIETDLSIRGKVAQVGHGTIGEVTDAIMVTFASNVEQMLIAGGAAATPTPIEAAVPQTGASPRSVRPPSATARTTAANIDNLDGWWLIVRPLLQRHAKPIATVLLTGLAAYLGARASARARARARVGAREALHTSLTHRPAATTTGATSAVHRHR